MQGRMSTSISYDIKGEAQRRPSNWNERLKNLSFKESLVIFLIKRWEVDNNAFLLEGKTLYTNCTDICYKFVAENDKVFITEVPDIYSTHIEGDSRIFYHLASINTLSNIVIRTSDKDSS